MRTSDHLTPGQVYTRKELSDQFGITDATINNGIFRPKGHDSVWLFVTRDKTADRVQFHDTLDGDVLTIEGQLAGRTDHLISEHVARGLELLLFYRDDKGQYPGAGFRYEGIFAYDTHTGSSPTRFVLHRVDNATEASLGKAADQAEEAGVYEPQSDDDARDRVLASIVRRRGQRKFRDALLKAYGRKCAITGCTVTAILEAAHIRPYMGSHTNVTSNGLLLRADLHTLFDLGLIAVDAVSMKVLISPSLAGTEYAALAGQKVTIPVSTADMPEKGALAWHRAGCGW